MKSYILYVPNTAAKGDAAGLDKAVVIKDGFAWWALVFPLLWLLLNRMWLGTLFYLLGAAALGAIGYALSLSEAATTLLHLAFAVYVALEANELRGWTLRRRGFAAVDAVTASSHAAAELKLFSRWLGEDRYASPVLQPVQAPRPLTPRPAGQAPAIAGTHPIVGLFPEPGGGR